MEKLTEFLYDVTKYITRGCFVLKYEFIANDIRQFILDNNLEQSSQLPKIDELVKKYNASKNTVIKALEILEQQGIIYQVQGSGIFVRRKHRDGYINLLTNQGFYNTLKKNIIESDILDFKEIPADERAAKYLKCPIGETLFLAKRLRYKNGEPFCIETSLYKKSVVGYLNEDILKRSIFQYLQEGLKLQFGFSDKYMTVSKLSKEESKLLKIKENDPALIIEEVYYLSSGEAFDLSKIIYNHKNTKFFIQGTGRD
ncbi:UbiC transcription regulator-associated domain protein [Treponema phagedenis F0421]|nr:UbiC transcription regulator-associated domain protein [Treponema phagedenis F0421]TYT79701.1 GntR family transcriptional regulator [Treponema phagedenis]